MRKLLLVLGLSLLASNAWGQCSGVYPPGAFCGNPTTSNSTPRAVVPGFVAPITITGAEADPSLVHNSPIILGLNGSVTGTQLAFGLASSTPFYPWIQARHWTADFSTQLFLQPLHGGLAIDVTSTAGLGLGLISGVQIGDNWTNTPTYSPPAGPFSISALNVYGTGGAQGIAVFGRTSNISGAGLVLSSYAFADNADPRGAWPIYTEGHRITQKDYAGIEISAVNRYNGPVDTIGPFGGTSTDGTASGVQLECGNGVSIASYAEYSCSMALFITNNIFPDQVNGHGFTSGIVFFETAMDLTVNPIAPAIAFPSSTTHKYALTWYTSATHRLWNIYADGTSTVANNSIVLGNTAMTVNGSIIANNDLTVNGVAVFNKGSNRFVFEGPGAGAFYDSITTPVRFFAGTDNIGDAFRIFTSAVGNSFILMGGTGQIILPQAIASTAFGNGALVIAGGVGISGDVFTNGIIDAGANSSRLTGQKLQFGLVDALSRDAGTGRLTISTNASNIHIFPASAVTILGTTDAASPAAQTLQVQNVVGGTSNTAGANWTINASQGTGTGVGGNIIFRVAPAGGSGSSQNALLQALIIDQLAHLRVSADTAPALTSCGTTPAISGTDQAGEVTMGTGSPTGCVITFNRAYANAPYCTVSWQVNIASMQYAVATTAITLTQTATSSNKVNYTCFARNAG